mgnify:CR=1 FL=1
MEAGDDGIFGDDDDGLLEAVVLWLAGSDEHECPTLAGGGGRFDQQVLLTALVVGPFLHGAHPQLVGFGGAALLGVGDGNGGDSRRGAHGSMARTVLRREL